MLSKNVQSSIKNLKLIDFSNKFITKNTFFCLDLKKITISFSTDKSIKTLEEQNVFKIFCSLYFYYLNVPQVKIKKINTKNKLNAELNLFIFKISLVEFKQHLDFLFLNDSIKKIVDLKSNLKKIKNFQIKTIKISFNYFKELVLLLNNFQTNFSLLDNQTTVKFWYKTKNKEFFIKKNNSVSL